MTKSKLEKLREWTTRPRPFVDDAAMDEVLDATQNLDVLGNQQIYEICEELKEFLVKKNTSYSSAAFKDSVVGKTTVKARDAILVRISDKLRRLTSGGDYQEEDTLMDLCGYIILLKSLEKLG